VRSEKVRAEEAWEDDCKRVLVVWAGRCVWERDVYSGRAEGGFVSESEESEPEDGLSVKKSWLSSGRSSSTEAGSEGEVVVVGESGFLSVVASAV
jgi:hypothetical protein